MVWHDLERRDLIVQALETSGLDALICGLPANVLMISGYWPVLGKSIACCTKDGLLAVIAPEDEREFAEASGGEVRLYSPPVIGGTDGLQESISPVLKDLLEKHDLSKARFGIEVAAQLVPSSYVSLHVFGNEISEMVKQAAPDSVLVAADAMIADLRSRLTSEDIKKLKVSCAIASRAFQMGMPFVQPGRSEVEVASTFRRWLATAVGHDGIQRADGSVWCMSGPNAAHAYAAYQRSTNRRLQDGDLVLIHCNSHADGYWTDITRTFTLGEAHTRERLLFHAIENARSAALRAIHPGVCAKEVDGAARAVMTANGIGNNFKHGTGHGVGFIAIDHDAKPRIVPNSPDVIENGMAFNIEPGAYFEGWGGARHCDVVLCTEQGAEVLTNF